MSHKQYKFNLQTDPTYDPSEINRNPEWLIAWVLSECLSNTAPMNWSSYIWVAREIIKAQKTVKV